MKKLSLIFLILLCSCSYHFAGSGNFPKEIDSIHINLFENNSSEEQIEDIFTDDLTNEFLRRKFPKITNGKEAKALAYGKINLVREESIESISSSNEKQIFISVSLNVFVEDKKWFSKTMSKKKRYFENEESKEEIIEYLSKRFAEDFYSLMGSDF